jgi:redox-sensitive bicupin YhaK (pirin superfamily)
MSLLQPTRPAPEPETAVPRPIAFRTRGRPHGPIVRLVSPSDVGESIKPFVFLDYFDVDAKSAPRFGFHPHSGIATLTVLLEGALAYEDSTGAAGTLGEGSVEWMQAGGGVWHTGHCAGERMRGFQLWVALPPALENTPPSSRYLDKSSIASHGPARVILGEYRGIRSPIVAPSSMNTLEVRLKAGETWRYEPPTGHDVAWVAVHRGRAQVPDAIDAGELAVFAQAPEPITFTAQADTGFVLGSAVKHPHELVLGYYSVHTSVAALKKGEAGIERVGEELRRGGLI